MGLLASSHRTGCSVSPKALIWLLVTRHIFAFRGYSKHSRSALPTTKNGTSPLLAILTSMHSLLSEGMKTLSQRGILAYIVPHKFFQSGFGEGLRRLLTARKALSQVVRFGAAQVFDESTTYTCLLFLTAIPQEKFDLFEVKSLDTGEEVPQNARLRKRACQPCIPKSQGSSKHGLGFRNRRSQWYPCQAQAIQGNS